MNVKPMLLTVIETHLLKLGTMLRPALTGMVVGLLPGLEEGAETYDRVNALLEQISHGVGLSYFYSAIWEAMLLSASVRCQGNTGCERVRYAQTHKGKRISGFGSWIFIYTFPHDFLPQRRHSF